MDCLCHCGACGHAREHWYDLIPCDILAFSEMWPLVRHHPLLAIVAALLKEPFALPTWRHTKLFDPCHHAGSELTAESFDKKFQIPNSSEKQEDGDEPEADQADMLEKCKESYSSMVTHRALDFGSGTYDDALKGAI